MCWSYKRKFFNGSERFWYYSEKCPVICRICNNRRKITISDDVKEYLLTNDYPYMYGARPVKRILQNHIEDKLADILINETSPKRKVFKAVVKDNEVLIK